jgi:hypothetical protein
MPSTALSSFSFSSPSSILDLLRDLPILYRDWWINLYHESPQHIFIETTLVIFIVWLLFIRRTVDPNKTKKSNLSSKEIEWLIDSWQPEPLAAKLDSRSYEICNNVMVFTHHPLRFVVLTSSSISIRLWRLSMEIIYP